jgi:hypothetical protein
MGQGMGPGMDGPSEHPMLGERYLSMLERRLSLSAEQKDKVGAAVAGSKAELKKKFDAIRKAHKELQALEKQVKSQIRETLTEKQKKSFDQMDQMRPGGPGMQGGMRQGGMGQDQDGMGQGRGGRRMMGPGGPRGPRGGQQQQGESGDDE